ncbi:MAG: septum site-determining protein MinC [Pseudomonadota bacterium]
MTEVLTDTQPIRLKGRSFLALVLSPELPFEAWLARLDSLASQSAGFFLRRPIVLNVEGLEIDGKDLRDLLAKLGERDVRIMGIEGADASLLGDDVPPGLTGGLPASVEDTKAMKKQDDSAAGSSKTEAGSDRATPSMMVVQPVRSGQSLISEGDVTVVGSVASGAEIIAAGSVHVYGTIRGRVVAGSMGNETARIFCRRLDAELVSIAGYYKTSEDLEPELREQAVQLWLKDESLLAEKLG